MAGWLQWVVGNGTAESPLVFSVFHLLMAGLTLVVLLYQWRSSQADARARDRGWAFAFGAFSLAFLLLTISFGAQYFLQASADFTRLERLAHGALTGAMLLLLAGFRGGRSRWALPACLAAIAIALLDGLFTWPAGGFGGHHSVLTLANDAAALLAAFMATKAAAADGSRRGYLLATLFATSALVLHLASVFLRSDLRLVAWNGQQALLSLSLFAFAWLAGERSPQLLDRIFVRLNLTFIVLVTIIMLTTVEMQRYQYVRLAEQRSTELGDYLRDQVLRYYANGERLPEIARHSSIADRIAAESVNLPELRRVHLYLDGQKATFICSRRSWELAAHPAGNAADSAEPAAFRLLRVPLGPVIEDRSNRIELTGSLEYINRYTGHYVVLVYAVFTVVVLLSTCVIGIIVAETDRHLQRKYAELQHTYQKLAQAEKLASVGELAGGMAHQINTPVTSILSLATHLAQEKTTAALSDRQRKSLQIIAQQAQRVSSIVTGLLNFSRQSRLHFTSVDVAEVVNTAVALVQYRLGAGPTLLERRLAPDLPLVHADAGALTEVLVNLLNNAIDAMPGGGVLTISASRDDEDRVRVEVRDKGIGIGKKELPRIFDPFYTTKEPGRGTGLGLSISHGIVKEHGGDIWACSEAGAGTTVVFTIPQERCGEEAHSGRG